MVKESAMFTVNWPIASELSTMVTVISILFVAVPTIEFDVMFGR